MGIGKEELTKTIGIASQSRRARQRAVEWNTVIQFELEGEEKPFCLVFNDGKGVVRDGAHIKPDIVVTGDTKDLARVATGDVSITHPIAQGKMRVARGKFLELIRLERVIMDARKRG